MGARIIQLAERRQQRSGQGAEVKAAPDALDSSQRFHFWRGVSGRRYVHSIYSLIECPAIPAANYLLVARSPDGQRRVLEVGRTGGAARSLNLAEVRRRGALAGANEVHVHLLAESDKQRELVELDLRASEVAQATMARCANSCH